MQKQSEALIWSREQRGIYLPLGLGRGVCALEV